MRDTLYQFAVQLFPPIKRLDETDRYAAASYVIRAVVFSPLALIGIVWLALGD